MRACATLGISFPPALIGLIGVFISMLTINQVKPDLAEQVSQAFTPAVGLLKVWLPMMLVPPMVVAPLKAAQFLPYASRIALLISVGSLASTVTGAGVAEILKGTSRNSTSSTSSMVEKAKELTLPQQLAASLRLPPYV